MSLDFVACEKQFLEHAAPVWDLLRPPHRGRFIIDASLVDSARARGVDGEAIDAERLRRSSPPPTARPGDGPAAFVTSIGDMKIARRLGYRRFVFMEHGAGQAYRGAGGVAAKNPSYSGGMDREDVELFLVPNEYSASLWRSTYPAATVAIVGSPRIDTLPRRVNGPQTVAVSWHWPARVCPEAGTALDHYWKALPDLALTYNVIGHAHPKEDWPAKMARMFAKAGIEFVPDFDDVCRRADVYVCDNSSTIFEFASTGRPVVVLNAPQYRRSVHHGLRFWNAAHVGVNVDEPGDLIAGVAEALQDAPQRQIDREDALSLVYQPRTNGGAAAVSAIYDWFAAQRVTA